jgi:hypothetical protein
MSYVVMPENDWRNILNSVRSKTEKNSPLLSGEVSSEIDSIVGGNGNIPTYHYVESARLVKKIADFKADHPNSLIFGAVSDIHINDKESTKTSIKHASFALETVGAMSESDFIVNLGDNCGETHIDPNITNSACGLTNAQYSINTLKPTFDRLISFNLVGNHDKTNDTQTQYDLIGVHNDFDVYSSTRIRGFGYKDFTDKKVRVICLNTCDYLNTSGGCALSYEQKDFLMRALDLSAKSNSSSWQILLLSHIPLDWNDGDYNFYTDLQTILNAYEDGTTASITVNSSYALNETPSNYATYSSGKLVYNYSGKNAARIIANIHGHIHTNKVSKVANTDIVRVATANTNPDLNKSESYPTYGDYSITTTEANKIKKVSGTAKDTSATFYCIDLDEQIIYAYGYGADIDRTIIYKDVTTYAVSYNLKGCTSSNTAKVVPEGSTYVTNIVLDDSAVVNTVIIKMNGEDITGAVYSEGAIAIYNVNGDISITVLATVPLITETITPHIAPRSSWYNQLVDGNLNLASSNMECALGVSTANSYSFVDRNSKTFYLMPIDNKYCKATLNYSATDGLAVQYYLQAIKDNGGTFTSIATVGKGTNNVITWDKGTANYLLISIEHTDGVTKWDWSSAGKTITVEFSNDGVDNGGGGDSTPTYKNVIDEVGTVDNVRLRSGGTTGDAAGFASNYFPVKAGDIIRVSFPNGNRASIPSNGMYCVLYSDTNGTVVATYDSGTSSTVLKNATTTGYEIHIPSSVSCSYARVAGGPNGAYSGWVVTVNEEIK